MWYPVGLAPRGSPRGSRWDGTPFQNAILTAVAVKPAPAIWPIPANQSAIEMSDLTVAQAIQGRPGCVESVSSAAMDAEGQDDPEAGGELLTFLVSAYRTLQDRWETAFFDEGCRQDAPWSTLIDTSPAEDPPMTPGEQLMWHAEETAVVAALAVGHHLGLLARAYWFDPLDPDGPVSGRWLYSAPYASARAIAEGTAMVQGAVHGQQSRSGGIA